MKMAESSERIENTVGKEEIARYDFFFSKCFKRLVLQTRKNHGLFGKGLTHYHTMLHSRNIAVENIVRKGEIAC